MLLAAREKETERTKQKILPVMQAQYKRVKRMLGSSNIPLRKRIGKVKIDDPTALRKVQAFLKQEQPKSDRDQWEDYKKEFLAALILALLSSVDEMGTIENEIMTSRGFNPLTYESQQVVDDYQMRIGRNLGGIIDTVGISLERIITEWYGGEEGFPVLMNRIEKLFNDARAEGVADTEVGNVLSQIIFQTMLSHGLKDWYWDALGENPCHNDITIAGKVWQGCFHLHGHIFHLGDPEPPDAAHPHCKCLPTPIGM
jgi:hypothetical protein